MSGGRARPHGDLPLLPQGRKPKSRAFLGTSKRKSQTFLGRFFKIKIGGVPRPLSENGNEKRAPPPAEGSEALKREEKKKSGTKEKEKREI